MVKAGGGDQEIWLRVTREAMSTPFNKADPSERRARQLMEDYPVELESACNTLVRAARVEVCDQVGLGRHLEVKILEGNLERFIPMFRFWLGDLDDRSIL